MTWFACTLQSAQSSGRLRRFMGAIPPDVPAIPCSDFSGVIHATGKHTEFEVGEEVYGMKFSFEGDFPLLVENLLCLPLTVLLLCASKTLGKVADMGSKATGRSKTTFASIHPRSR